MEKEEFLQVYRHSMAHILAKAVIELFGKEVQYAIGPQIENGLYYDFVLPRTVSQDDFKTIEEVILLVDIRHDPTRQDVQMFEFLKAATGYEPLVVLTKTDKINRSQIRKQTEQARKVLGASQDCTMIPFSATTKQGLEEIHSIVENLSIDK